MTDKELSKFKKCVGCEYVVIARTYELDKRNVVCGLVYDLQRQSCPKSGDKMQGTLTLQEIESVGLVEI